MFSKLSKVNLHRYVSTGIPAFPRHTSVHWSKKNLIPMPRFVHSYCSFYQLIQSIAFQSTTLTRSRNYINWWGNSELLALLHHFHIWVHRSSASCLLFTLHSASPSFRVPSLLSYPISAYGALNKGWYSGDACVYREDSIFSSDEAFLLRSNLLIFRYFQARSSSLRWGSCTCVCVWISSGRRFSFSITWERVLWSTYGHHDTNIIFKSVVSVE